MEPKPKNRKLIRLIAFVAIFLIGVFVGSNSAAKPSHEVVAVNGETAVVERPAAFSSIDLSMFWSIWDEVQDNYVYDDRLDNQKMTYGAIKGLVDSLEDPYTGFLDPAESKLFRDSLNAELEGIGAELTVEDDLLKIVSPLKDSPAAKAGIRPGDIIYKINDELAADYDLFQAVKQIRGPKGTQVTLTIIRDSIGEPFDVIITRGKIELESVTTEELEDGIFLISINQFSDDTLGEFLEATRQAILFNAKGIILDLRYNGGGYLEIAVDILGEFLQPGQRAVTVESRGEQLNQEMKANGKSRLATIPTVVLINEGSASASEILAGALQDYELGYLIGQQSFGKGTVQEVKGFVDGSSLRLTVARWLTPNGRTIDGEGLTPDLNIAITEADVASGIDTQLESAKTHLRELNSN